MRALIDAYAARFNETIPAPMPGSLELVERLDAAGVPLFAITNFGHEFWEGFRPTQPIFDRFQDIIVSGTEKLMKPDPAIYRLAIERFGIDPRARCSSTMSPRMSRAPNRSASPAICSTARRCSKMIWSARLFAGLIEAQHEAASGRNLGGKAAVGLRAQIGDTERIDESRAREAAFGVEPDQRQRRVGPLHRGAEIGRALPDAVRRCRRTAPVDPEADGAFDRGVTERAAVALRVDRAGRGQSALPGLAGTAPRSSVPSAPSATPMRHLPAR